MTADPAGFVRAHTRVAEVPFLPEIRLHQAADVIGLWQATEKRAGMVDSPPPFWAFAWAGGQALARYLLDHPEVAAGRTVLDLAAGSGLVGIAAALACAARVTANEIDAYAVAAITLNAAANRVPVEVVAGDLLDGRPPAVDVVLAGDVFYRRPMAERVLPFLDRARRAGAEVLVGDPGRAYLPRERFVRVSRYIVPVVADLEDAAVKPVDVWRFPAR